MRIFDVHIIYSILACIIHNSMRKNLFSRLQQLNCLNFSKNDIAQMHDKISLQKQTEILFPVFLGAPIFGPIRNRIGRHLRLAWQDYCGILSGKFDNLILSFVLSCFPPQWSHLVHFSTHSKFPFLQLIIRCVNPIVFCCKLVGFSCSAVVVILAFIILSCRCKPQLYYSCFAFHDLNVVLLSWLIFICCIW